MNLFGSPARNMGFQLLISQMDEQNESEIIPSLRETLCEIIKTGLEIPQKSLAVELYFASRLIEISLENISTNFTAEEKIISEWILKNSGKIEEILSINQFVFSQEEEKSDEIDRIDTFSVTSALLSSGKVRIKKIKIIFES